MNTRYLIKGENSRLIIFFTGFSTDWKVVEGLHVPKGYDFLCVWGYDRVEEIVPDKDYSEIIVVAWSLGVKIADYLLPKISMAHNVTGCFAINGSIWPVNDEKGIPCEVFKATMENLDNDNLKKFKIRTTGGRKKFEILEDKLKGEDDILILKQELKNFLEEKYPSENLDFWDCVFISEKDKIFPPSNLLKAWEHTPKRLLKDQDHLPDLQNIFNLILKDKISIGTNFEKTYITYDSTADVQNRLAELLVSGLSSLKREFENVLEIGSGAGRLSSLIQKRFSPGNLTLIDLATIPPLKDVIYICGDAELITKELSESNYDLVISGSALQWMHSPAKILRQAYRIIEPKGVLAFTTYIEDNFKEIYQLTGNSLLYYSAPEWEAMVSNAGFRIEKKEIIESTLEFEDLNSLFSHLRHTGVNSLGGKSKGVGDLRKMMRKYEKKDDRYPLTYRALLIIATKT